MANNQIYIRGNEMVTAEQIQEYIKECLSSLSGYNETAIQVLKNVNGTFTWVTEETNE